MILKVGSRGQEVKDLQEFLEIGADGIFGEGTKKAVQEFQKALTDVARIKCWGHMTNWKIFFSLQVQGVK